MARTPCSEKTGLKKGPWTPEEDRKLVDFIQKNGHGSWRALPMKAGLLRCGKSCRLRWTNYLRPDIKRGEFTFEEDSAIIRLHSALGNKWSTIAAQLPGRTDNEIKNYWNTHLKKRLTSIGIDPITHKAIAEAPHTGSNNVCFFNLLNQATEWDPSKLTTCMATEDRIAPYQTLGDHLSRDHDTARATFGQIHCAGLDASCSSQGLLVKPMMEENRGSAGEGRGGYFGNMLEGHGGYMNPTASFNYD